MQININGKLFLAIIFMMCSIGIGAYSYKEIKEAKEIESAIVLISVFGGNSSTNNLLNGLANVFSGGVATNSNIAEELAHQAQKQKQIGILLMLISLTIFISSIYFLWKIGRENKPIA